MKITYWADFACPFCYVGETNLHKALHELGLEDSVEMHAKAYELNPQAPEHAVGTMLANFAHSHNMTEDEAAARIESISQMGRDAGLDFDFINSRVTNTLDAHRLFKFAQEKSDRETVNNLQKLLFDAFFAKGLELADHEVLMKLAIEAGLDREPVRAVLESDRYEEAVRHDEDEAAGLGITGVPYFIVGSESVPGSLTVDKMKQVIERAIAVEEAAARNEELLNGMTCSAEGCGL